MSKNHRRHIKRLAKKYDIDLFDALKLFYGKKENLNKNVVFTIYKKRDKGKVRKLKRIKKRKAKKVRKEVLSKFIKCDSIDEC